MSDEPVDQPEPSRFSPEQFGARFVGIFCGVCFWLLAGLNVHVVALTLADPVSGLGFYLWLWGSLALVAMLAAIWLWLGRKDRIGFWFAVIPFSFLALLYLFFLFQVALSWLS